MNEFLFTATFDSTESAQADGPIINELMAHFERMATVFGINIEVDCRSGKPIQISDVIFDREKIYFHIGSFPTRYYQTNHMVANTTIFGFTPAKPILTTASFPDNKTLPYQLPRTELFGPESKPIGNIVGPHVFIFPEILMSQEWTAKDRADLLMAFSYWFLPKAISNLGVDYSYKISNGLNSLRAIYRDSCSAFNENEIEKFFKKFDALVWGFNGGIISELEKHIAELEQKLTGLVGSYFKELSKNVLNKQRLQILESEILTRDFSKDFEILLMMESIEAIRVEGGRFLVIKTSPIFQIPIVDHETGEGKEYDTGEYVIRIDTNALPLSRNAIRLSREGCYLGPYRHIHIDDNPGNVCFGMNSDTGLNALIDGLIIKFDLVPLVHLILTFLKKEQNLPCLRDKWDDSVGPHADRYENEEERATEKELFVKFATETVVRLSTAELKREIFETNKIIYASHDQILETKELIHNQKALLNRLGACLSDFGSLNQEAKKIIDDESVFGINISDEGLLIFFHYPRIAITGGRSISDDYALLLTSAGMPRLLTATKRRLFQVSPLINIVKFASDGLTANDEIMIENLRSGHVWEILEAAKTMINNGDFDLKVKIKEDVKNG